MPAKKTKSTEAMPIGLDVLDCLIKDCYEGVQKSVKKQPKLGDLLKMIELRAKLAPQSSAQREFWNMLDKIRREKLAETSAPTGSDKPKAGAPKSLKQSAKARSSG